MSDLGSITELRNVIRKMHGAEATHRESISVREVFEGQTVWDGIVEVFHLHEHSKTDTVYAWMHDTGDPGKAVQHVTVLHIHPALSPLAAVRAFLIQEFRNAQPT